MYQQAITTAGTDAYPFFFRLANNIAAKIDAAAKASEAKINKYRIIFSTIFSPNKKSCRRNIEGKVPGRTQEYSGGVARLLKYHIVFYPKHELILPEGVGFVNLFLKCLRGKAVKCCRYYIYKSIVLLILIISFAYSPVLSLNSP